MKRANARILNKVRLRVLDTLDGDYDGENIRTYVAVTQQDLDDILTVIADEVGVEISQPVTDDEFTAVYDAIRTDDAILCDLWDIIDGWVPGARSSLILESLPTVEVRLTDRGSFLKAEEIEYVEWEAA